MHSNPSDDFMSLPLEVPFFFFLLRSSPSSVPCVLSFRHVLTKDLCEIAVLWCVARNCEFLLVG